MSEYPFNGRCPYCNQIMVAGMHWTSWAVGLLAGLVAAVAIFVILHSVVG